MNNIYIILSLDETDFIKNFAMKEEIFTLWNGQIITKEISQSQ